MGCLRNIIKSIILTLAVIGFITIGGKEFITNLTKKIISPSSDKMIERTQLVGDFSQMDEEFEIEKAVGLMGYNAVIAEHKTSGQKMVVVDSGTKPIITAKDLQSENVEKKLINSVKKIKYNAISIENLSVTKKGNLHAYNQTVPYIKFEAKVNRLPIKEVSGIVSVVKTDKGQEKLLISVGKKDDFSQIISENFFKNIK